MHIPVPAGGIDLRIIIIIYNRDAICTWIKFNYYASEDNASEDNELSALEAEIAELSVKPMSKDQRAAVDQLARTELKIAMMKVIGAWKQTEFTLPEHQADSSAAEVASLE